MMEVLTPRAFSLCANPAASQSTSIVSSKEQRMRGDVLSVLLIPCRLRGMMLPPRQMLSTMRSMCRSST